MTRSLNESSCHGSPVEAVIIFPNNRIKLIKRQAYGFANFHNFRERLLACFSY
ncbi:MAG: transposase [Cyanobacteria bacterium J06636_16]